MKKRIHIGEFVAEKSIALVSMASLACIGLICIFVFREALPIFQGGRHPTYSGAARDSVRTKSPAGVPGSEVGPPETYGEAEPVKPVGPSETYGEAPSNSAVGPSETYGDSSTAAVVGQSESYGDPIPDSLALAVPPERPEGTAALAESAVVDTETKAAPFSLEDLGGTDWKPVSSHPKFAILPLAIGSLKVALIALLIAGPVGVLSALFSSTFAPRWAKETMKPLIELLAGIPSVVIGFLALVSLASTFQAVFGLDYRLNALLGGLAMSLAVVPIVYTLSEEALAAVPRSYTEGSLALGATRWETNLRVVLPAAVPGIFASLLLGLGRAFGETMIVLMATGNAALASFSLTEPVRSISAAIGAEMAEVVFGEVHYTVLFLLGAILFLFSFLLNLVAEVFVRDRLMKRFGGSR